MSLNYYINKTVFKILKCFFCVQSIDSLDKIGHTIINNEEPLLKMNKEELPKINIEQNKICDQIISKYVGGNWKDFFKVRINKLKLISQCN